MTRTGRGETTTTPEELRSVNDLLKEWYVPLKVLYFFYYASAVLLGPFLPVFLADALFLSKTEIGVLTAASPLCSMLGSFVLCAIADRVRHHNFILVACVCVRSVAQVTLIALPSGTSFVWPLAFLCVRSFFNGGATPLLDSTALRILGPKRSDWYGRQRLWGAVGWGVFALASGRLRDAHGWSSVFALGVSLDLLGALLMFIFLRGWNVTPEPGDDPLTPIDRGESRDSVQESLGESDDPDHPLAALPPITSELSFAAKLRVVLSDWVLLSFLVSCVALGFGANVISQFLFLFLESLGADNLLMGVSLVFTVIVEIGLFAVADKLLGLFGHRAGIVLAHVAYVARVFLYGLLTDPWWVLPIELFHGATYAAMWASGISFVNSRAPKGLEATCQGLFQGAWSGIGFAIGALGGGILYDNHGAVRMFQVAGVIACGSLVWFVVTQFALVRLCGTPNVNRALAKLRSEEQERGAIELSDFRYGTREQSESESD